MHHNLIFVSSSTFCGHIPIEREKKEIMVTDKDTQECKKLGKNPTK